MTDESITRKKAEERLDNCYYGASIRKNFLDLLFPPKPVFKKGELIAVRGNNSFDWVFRKFIEMAENGYYLCELESTPNHKHSWKYARSQTNKEKGK